MAFSGTRRAFQRVPAAARACFLVAWLSATSWAFITPPFEVPDEPSHYAYVRQLAQTGTLPTSSSNDYSQEENLALELLRSRAIRFDPDERAIFSPAQQATLDQSLQALNRSSGGEGSPAAGVATSEPPLYYALESIPYRLGSGGTLLDRLQLMRLLSALMAGFTALFTFLFLREALPAARWAWVVGGLGVALSPLFGFMSGAVNPDAMLFAVSAALFYCIARAFRRGLTYRSATATGLVIAVGFATKLSFIGLAPGAYVALAAVAIREARHRGRSALLPGVSAALIGCMPLLLLLAVSPLSGNTAFASAGSAIANLSGSLLDRANYVWQLYLPRLPGTVNDFPGIFPARQIWFDHYVGQLGWIDTFFPGWVYTVALIPAGLIAALCTRELVARRAALRRRAPELTAYALMTLGAMVLVGAASYGEFPKQTDTYGQARYLLPMLPLLGAVLALAARGAGRRWGRSVGALMVVLFLGHDIFSQLQVIARYYG